MTIIEHKEKPQYQEPTVKTRNNSLTVSLGQAIRRQRQKLSLSQEKLADFADLHRTYIGAVERGERNITLVNCDKIARALHLKFSQLVRQAEAISDN